MKKKLNLKKFKLLNEKEKVQIKGGNVSVFGKFTGPDISGGSSN